MPKFKGRKGGSLNRNTVTVRLGLFRNNFNSIDAWVRAFNQLDALSETGSNEDKLKAVTEKIKSLEKLFKFIFPELTSIPSSEMELLEAIEVESKSSIDPTDLSTEDLLLMAGSEKKDE